MENLLLSPDEKLLSRIQLILGEFTTASTVIATGFHQVFFPSLVFCEHVLSVIIA